MSCPTKQQSTTRNKYDDFHQVDDNRISTYAGRYQLNAPAQRCPTTFPSNSTIRLQMSGANWPEGHGCGNGFAGSWPIQQPHSG